MTLKHHIRETAVLSLPLVISQIGHIITGMVDNIFLGRIGKTEQAAGILANNLFILLLVFSIGMSYSLTPLVSQAHAKNNDQEKAFLLKNGLYLNFGISILLSMILYFASPLLHFAQQPKDVVDLSLPFFHIITISIIPCSLFFAGKQYTEGLNNTVIAMVVSVVGNLLNILLNYLLINGKWGLPEMGYMGSCWATFIARCFMGGFFVVLLFYSKPFKSFRPFLRKAAFSIQHCWQLFKLGIGFAMQFTFEVTAFALSGLMTGWYGKEQIDAHGIALSIAAFTYMFSSGISGAATIRVGNFKGQNDYVNVNKASNASMISVLVVMGGFAMIFFLLHSYLPQAFSTDQEVIGLASKLLIIAGFFQLFDGMQVTILGILRGLGDVRVPTIITLIGYWIICLPLSYFFGKTLGYTAQGIWSALLCGLSFVAVALYIRFRILMKRKLLQ
ncbi:MAG: MATE family efflux transporter [Bacteroidota bacterium]|nr:MATE family efflux transporter [Bacteroidota bacterium]